MDVPGKPRAGRPRVRYGPAVLWAVVVVAASVAPASGPGLAATGPFGVGVDVWLHAAGYAVLGALLARGTGSVAAAVVVAAVFGAGVEGVQSLLATRTASLADATANAVGATAGAVVDASLRRNELDDGE